MFLLRWMLNLLLSFQMNVWKHKKCGYIWNLGKVNPMPMWLAPFYLSLGTLQSGCRGLVACLMAFSSSLQIIFDCLSLVNLYRIRLPSLPKYNTLGQMSIFPWLPFSVTVPVRGFMQEWFQLLGFHGYLLARPDFAQASHEPLGHHFPSLFTGNEFHHCTLSIIRNHFMDRLCIWL